MSGSATKRITPRNQHHQQQAWAAGIQEEEGAVEEGRGGGTKHPKRSAVSSSSAGFLFDWVLAPLTGLIDRASSPKKPTARTRDHDMSGGVGGKSGTAGIAATNQNAVTLESIEDQDFDEEKGVAGGGGGGGGEGKTATKSGGGRSSSSGDGNNSGRHGGSGTRTKNPHHDHRGGRTVRQIHEQYETSPFEVWFGMIIKLLSSALTTAGLAIAAVMYPVFALTPSPVLDSISRGLFNIGYLIYMSAIGRWMHLRMVRAMRETRRRPHSRGIRPSVCSTCSILPIPFLNDNYSYLLVDHVTREAAAIDPADPYTMRDVAKRLSLKLVAVLTTHKHHDHAGGNFELQKAYGGSLTIYGHSKDNIPGVTEIIKGGDRFKVGETEIGVVHVPCHTTGHVVFAVLGDGSKSGGGGGVVNGGGVGGDDSGSGAGLLPLHRVEALFTGDAIINGGVGAFFHGGPRDCYDNLHVRLAGMPDAALVFSGHEYMLMNLRFSKWLDEDNEPTAVALREVAIRRHHHLSTMPSSLAVERRVNPYFRITNRAFLDKVFELQASIEAGKRKRWYRRYISFFTGKEKNDGGGESGGGGKGGGVFAGVSMGQSLGNPTVAECVQGIKAIQDLAQYRHLLDQVGGGGGGGDDDERRPSRVEGDGSSGDPPSGSQPSSPPSPGPVSTTDEDAEEESDDDAAAGLWGGRSASRRPQPPPKKKNEPQQELKNLLNNL